MGAHFHGHVLESNGEQLPENTANDGRLVHGWQAPWEVLLQAQRHWPAGHGSVVHEAHVSPVSTNPESHSQAQVFGLKRFAFDVYRASLGLLVHATQIPSRVFQSPILQSIHRAPCFKCTDKGQCRL